MIITIVVMTAPGTANSYAQSRYVSIEANEKHNRVAAIRQDGTFALWDARNWSLIKKFKLSSETRPHFDQNPPGMVQKRHLLYCAALDTFIAKTRNGVMSIRSSDGEVLWDRSNSNLELSQWGILGRTKHRIAVRNGSNWTLFDAKTGGKEPIEADNLVVFPEGSRAFTVNGGQFRCLDSDSLKVLSTGVGFPIDVSPNGDAVCSISSPKTTIDAGRFRWDPYRGLSLFAGTDSETYTFKITSASNPSLVKEEPGIVCWFASDGNYWVIDKAGCQLKRAGTRAKVPETCYALPKLDFGIYISNYRDRGLLVGRQFGGDTLGRMLDLVPEKTAQKDTFAGYFNLFGSGKLSNIDDIRYVGVAADTVLARGSFLARPAVAYYLGKQLGVVDQYVLVRSGTIEDFCLAGGCLVVATSEQKLVAWNIVERTELRIDW